MATIQPSQPIRSSSGKANEQSDEISTDYSTLLETVTASANQLMFSVSSEQLLDLYYEFFHSTHPFILPQHFLVQRFQSNSRSLEDLLAVMQYIGAIYAPWTTSNLYKEKAETTLFGSTLGKTGFHV
ncbi:hypothetical protein V2W45_696992 [Cenococcum geophilum]